MGSRLTKASFVSIARRRGYRRRRWHGRWLGSLPYLVYAVAGFVAGLAVLGPVVQGLTYRCPLFRTVVSRDDGVAARGFVRFGGHEGRPVGRARTGAGRFAAAGRVFVERVERHAVGTDQHAVGHHGRGGIQGAASAQKGERQGPGKGGARAKFHDELLS